MALKKKTTEAQAPLVAQFEFDLTDTMVDINGVTQAFSGNGIAFDVLTLPYGSQVIGGDIVVKTASNAVTTNTLSVGDSALATRYATTVDLKTAARTALTITGFKTAAAGLRLTFAQTGGAATLGTVKVSVMFTIDKRAHENLKTT